MKLIILGREYCSGCLKLKDILLTNNVEFNYVIDENEIQKYRKHFKFSYFPHILIVNENNDIVESYEYSQINTKMLIERFGKNG